LAKKSFHGGLVLSHLDQPPVSLAGQRIDILLPQKPDIVRLLQLIHRSRIMSELPVVKLNRSHILIRAVLRLNLALTSQRPRNLRRSRSQNQQDQKDGNDQPHEHVTLLIVPPRNRLCPDHIHLDANASLPSSAANLLASH
jgi:hypothetical protein